MSLSAILAQAALQAQGILAPLADPDGGGIFTIGVDDFTGVLNLRQIDTQLGPNGVLRVEELTITATAAQFDSTPTFAPRTAVTAYGRDWLITKVDEGGTHHTFTCVPA
jgi:hypothetical protein